jgi:hypothetical protein
MPFSCAGGRSDKSAGASRGVQRASRGVQSNAKLVRKNQNPLYVWEAITRCLEAGEPLPDWCLAYLRDTAENLYSLACGGRFSRAASGRISHQKISPEQAVKLIATALGLSKQGKRNAFASLRVDRHDMHAGLDDRYYGRDAGVPEIQMLRNLTRKSARRRIARGKHLNVVKRKTSA